MAAKYLQKIRKQAQNLQPLLVREVELANISVLGHKKRAGVCISIKKSETGPFSILTA